MLKKFIIILICFLLLISSSYISYEKGKKDAKASIKVLPAENTENFCMPHYPLIDIYFDENNQWTVINRENLFTDDESFSIIQNPSLIEMNKEFIILNSFPVGRGTTPSGKLYVYKNSELIKEIPYSKCRITSKILKENFFNVSMEQAENLINSKFPPLI